MYSTQVTVTTARSNLLLLTGYWLLNTMFSSLFSFTLYFTVQYVHERPSLPHIQVSCYLLAVGFWTPCSTAHFSFTLYFTVQFVHESHLLPHVQVLTVLAIGCPNQLFHCTVRFTHESPLLPHVHISYYLGLMYWLLVWVILWSAAHSALHYNYFIVKFVHESPSLPHVQVSLYLLIDI